VAGDSALMRVRPGAPPERVLTGYRIIDVLSPADGAVLALTIGGQVVLVPLEGSPALLTNGAALPTTRAISIAERSGTLWISTDRYLFALGPYGAAEVLGPEHGIVAGGPLLVDHEGSLWHAGFTTLSQYPEPATRYWNERHGLNSAHTRFVARSGDALWVTTWQGTGFVQRRSPGSWQAGWAADRPGRGEPCTDGRGGLRIGTTRGIEHVIGTRTVALTAAEAMDAAICAPGSAGYWIGTADGVHYLSDRGELRRIESFPAAAGERGVQALLEDAAGTVWAASFERVCRAAAADVLGGGDVAWSCDPLPPGIVHANALAELSDGTIWLASNTMGLLRHTASGWELIEQTTTLPTTSLLNLTPSPRGGVWLVGTGVLHRVQPTPGGAGWEVVERLSAWQGLPSVGGGDLFEEDDGTIWVATALGAVQVPAAVRADEPRPPRLALVEARVDGEAVPLDEPLVLPANRNRLELRFAALTFREPGRVRYQVRLSLQDEWADTDGQPFFNWVDIPAGRHRPQVRASLDGVHWSAVPAELAFRVLPPWYRTSLAIAVFALLAAVLLWGLYRARLAYLLSVERQRTRIAMDLHDEMGSGLASIGILASVLADGGEAHGDVRLAREVAATADELGSALSDIVWSLDPHSATLEELAARLAEHGGRLFADEVQFDTAYPREWPSAPLPLPVLRNVLLIGLEALHNAARHARASHVVLALGPHSDGWLLSVQDDGAGLDAPAGSPGSGRGLRAMRRRATEIGGDLTLDSEPGRGTAVRLHFALTGGGWRLLDWLHARLGRGAHAGVPPPHDHAVARPGSMAHR
jgi:signal transduction histidine kinase